MDNNCSMIHETSLGHILDIWKSIMDIKNDADKSKSKPIINGSISRSASNLTMVFPVLCSRNISIGASSMVSKALEKNAVSMLQRLFASLQVVNSNVNNVQDYLALFHSNINTRAASLDDIFEINDKLVSKSKINTHESSMIRSDMRNIDFHLPTSINESSLRRFIVEGKDVTNINENDNKRGKSVYSKDQMDYFTKQVTDAEYKKANELMPTTMMINFSIKDDKGVITNVDNALCAVKAKLYPLGSDDIVKHIADKVIDRNWITNFFRASTREISFMKDFVLAIDKAKIDALSLSDRNRTTDKMWKVLERRATTSRLKKAMRSGDSASAAAITTLVISQEEVEYLRKYNNVDIEKVSTIINLFESLNLMCVCIVDESLELAKFIYDEQDPMWETISFTHLERESSDNTYKKVVNLMTKISR